jgi:hypothetical protein
LSCCVLEYLLMWVLFRVESVATTIPVSTETSMMEIKNGKKATEPLGAAMNMW